MANKDAGAFDLSKPMWMITIIMLDDISPQASAQRLTPPLVCNRENKGFLNLNRLRKMAVQGLDEIFFACILVKYG